MAEVATTSGVVVDGMTSRPAHGPASATAGSNLELQNLRAEVTPDVCNACIAWNRSDSGLTTQTTQAARRPADNAGMHLPRESSGSLAEFYAAGLIAAAAVNVFPDDLDELAAQFFARFRLAAKA